MRVTRPTCTLLVGPTGQHMHSGGGFSPSSPASVTCAIPTRGPCLPRTLAIVQVAHSIRALPSQRASPTHCYNATLSRVLARLAANDREYPAPRRPPVLDHLYDKLYMNAGGARPRPAPGPLAAAARPARTRLWVSARRPAGGGIMAAPGSRRRRTQISSRALARSGAASGASQPACEPCTRRWRTGGTESPHSAASGCYDRRASRRPVRQISR